MIATVGEIVGLMMDAETARQHVAMIQEHIARAEHHLGDARRVIFALKDGCGWQALGYKSWRQCVMAEFEQSSSAVYRQLDAAVIELELSPNGGIGQINERVLRPLTARKYTTESRQLIWDISQDIVGEGGKVTSGVVESVVEGISDWLKSGTVQSPDGDQLAITEHLRADLTARVREVRLAHKEHIKRMDAKRDYIVGGRKTDSAGLAMLNGRALASVCAELENGLEVDKLREAVRLGKTVYLSLWIEE